MRAALEDGARRLPALAGLVRAGQLDVGAAMTRLLAQPPSRGTVSLHVRVVRQGGRLPMLRWSTTGAGARRVRLELLGRHSTGRRVRVFGLARRSWIIREAAGRYRWRVVALDGAGQSVAVRAGHVRVRRSRG